MEIIRGKQTSVLSADDLTARLDGYANVQIDIGTGDGRFVQHSAQTSPDRFVIGIDACRENLRTLSRNAPANALFVIANAQRLPSELAGVATQVMINFPWGSLLDGLLADDPALMDGLQSFMQPKARLDVLLNGGALAEAGWTLDAGVERVQAVLAMNGFSLRPPTALTVQELRSFPTTWAKRLAFGRDPRAVWLSGVMLADAAYREIVSDAAIPA